VPGLLELQRSFAAGLREPAHAAGEWAAADGIAAEARLQVYRNNSRALFEQAVRLTFPVVLRRVGDDYFRQLAHFYRVAHPSRSGDLHDVGRAFAAFLTAHLADTPYAWLGELAALEWAVAEAGVAAESATASAATLAAVAPEAIEAVRFEFVPSLRLVDGSLPILSVWRANQGDAPETLVDLSAGPEFVVVHRGADGIELRSVARHDFAFVAALAGGEALGVAVDIAALPIDRLAGLLRWLFDDGIVAAVREPAAE